ncbi:hypothetical protein [Streptomyces sp. NPDC054834]
MPLRPAAAVGALPTREPIYAQLVSEWRAEGRTVPAGSEAPGPSPTVRAPRTRPEAGHR